jgi:hypothetical protein
MKSFLKSKTIIASIIGAVAIIIVPIIGALKHDTPTQQITNSPGASQTQYNDSIVTINNVTATNTPKISYRTLTLNKKTSSGYNSVFEVVISSSDEITTKIIQKIKVKQNSNLDGGKCTYSLVTQSDFTITEDQNVPENSIYGKPTKTFQLNCFSRLKITDMGDLFRLEK